MFKFFIAFVLVGVSIVSLHPNSAHATSQEKWGKLRAELEKETLVQDWEKLKVANEYKMLFQQLIAIQDYSDAETAIGWLILLIMGESETNYIYPLSYATLMQKIQYQYSGDDLADRRQSLAIHMYGMLLQQGDYLRCKGNKPGGREFNAILFTLTGHKKNFASLSAEDKALATQIALRMEELAKNRTPNEEVCLGKAEYVADTILELLPAEKHDLMNSRLGESAAKKAPAHFVTDSEWNSSREAMRMGVTFFYR